VWQRLNNKRLVERQLNGKAGLTFDGGNDRLTKTVGSVLAGGDDDYSYYAVWRPHVTGGVRRVYEQRGTTSNTYAALLAINGKYGFNGQNNDKHDLVPFTANQWRLTDMKVDNSGSPNIDIYDNGTNFLGATGNPGALNVGTTAGTIGSKNEGGVAEWFDGDLAELIVYESALTYAQRVDVNDYLSNKYNLGVSLPPPPPEGFDAIRHRWSFNDGTADDSIGGADGTLSGGASIVGQRLSIDGVAGSRMLTNAIGNGIGEKTLVVWTSLNDHTDSTKGSALTIENNSGGSVFDAIVYGEAAAQKWMAGSDGFGRTQNPQTYGTVETVSEPGEVMIAIVYAADNSITLYREGAPYGSYTKGSLVNWASSALVQIGPRHGTHNDVYDGFVNEARIYADALDAGEIAQLYAWGPNVLIPEPSALTLLILGGMLTLGLHRRRKRQ